MKHPPIICAAAHKAAVSIGNYCSTRFQVALTGEPADVSHDCDLVRPCHQQPIGNRHRINRMPKRQINQPGNIRHRCVFLENRRNPWRIRFRNQHINNSA